MSALFVYMLGVASMLASDILVTKFLNDADIALWADVRALFGILAAFVTLGIEMVIIRAPGASRLLLRLVLLQAVLLSLPLGFFVHKLGYLSSDWSAILLALGAAFSVVQGQYFRSHRAFLSSQIVQQGWRVVVLALMAKFVFYQDTTAWPIDLIAGAAVFLFSLFGWGLVLTGPRDLDDKDRRLPAFYAISFRFLVTNIILNMALFGEQMIVNGVGSNAEASTYFTHMTYFLLPVTIVTAFVGFRIGPWLRDNPVRFEALLKRNRLLLHVSILATVVFAHVVGWICWHIIKPAIGEPSMFLQAALFISATLRTYYVFPSAYNGIFGALREHDILIVTQIMLLIVIAAGIYVVYPSVDIVTVVAVAGVANWVVRTLIADRIMKVIMIRRKAQTQ